MNTRGHMMAEEHRDASSKSGNRVNAHSAGPSARVSSGCDDDDPRPTPGGHYAEVTAANSTSHGKRKAGTGRPMASGVHSEPQSPVYGHSCMPTHLPAPGLVPPGGCRSPECLSQPGGDSQHDSFSGSFKMMMGLMFTDAAHVVIDKQEKQSESRDGSRSPSRTSKRPLNPVSAPLSSKVSLDLGGRDRVSPVPRPESPPSPSAESPTVLRSPLIVTPISEPFATEEGDSNCGGEGEYRPLPPYSALLAQGGAAPRSKSQNVNGLEANMVRISFQD